MLSEIRSTVSFASRLIGSVKGEMNFEELSDEQLKSTLEEATRANRTLTLENEVFERYLRRKDPRCLEKLPQIVESARLARNISHLRASNLRGSQVGSTTSFTTSMGSGLMTQTLSGSQLLSMGGSVMPRSGALGIKITMAHRADLVNKEVEKMRTQFENFERSALKKKEAGEASSKEIKQRIADCEDAIARFENNVLKQADPITKQVQLEKFLRFVNDQLKSAAVITDKLNLKIITTNRLIRQTEKQIKQKKEMGKILRPIDFEQLRIETDYLIEESEKNQNILKSRKKMSGFYNRMLKNHRNKLNEKKLKLLSIEEALIFKKREKIESRRLQTRERHEIAKAKTQFDYVKELQNEYEVPEIDDYLRVQKKLQEEKKLYKRLSRRWKIQSAHRSL